MLYQDLHSYRPAEGHGLPHDPFNAIVGPRPIGWISTKGGTGRVNLAPYSFFNAFNYTPPIIGFASIGHKDTVRNIEATGEFVWNLVTRPLAEAMRGWLASTAGIAEAPGRLMPIASAIDIIVAAVPIVMQVPAERAMPSSSSPHSLSPITPARRSMRRARTATARLATAMPRVDALTARLARAGEAP